MLKKLIYRLLLSKRFEEAAKVGAFLETKASSIEAIKAFQVERFNEIWKDASKNVPFYGEWKKVYNLPDSINDLSELDGWPILTKQDILTLEKFKRVGVPEPSGHILTGGSTGTPVRLPAWPDTTSATSKIVGKSWYGIGVTDKVFLLWGHLHLYGKGLKRGINILKRRIKDWLAGWTRVSAYDLSKRAMEAAYRKMLCCCPELVIGYSPSILTFCRINREHAGEIKSVKNVLCSSGPLSKAEKEEIANFFGAKVCMEYGSVECGVIAYTHPSDGKYRVFWNTHLVQAVKTPSGEYKNIVTLLTRTYVPLIRYDIGDYLALSGETQQNLACVLQIDDVVGRPSEFIDFRCGVSFFGWAVGDCVKQCEKVINHQLVVDEQNDRLTIRVVVASELRDDDYELIRDRMKAIIMNVERLTVDFESVDTIPLAPSGKTIRVIRKAMNQVG